MAYFKTTSLVYILFLIHHSLAVLNNFENKNENIDDKRTLCVGGDAINKNDAILDPIVVNTESVSSVKVNKHTGSIEDRTSSVSTNFELPFSSYDNPLSFYSSSKPHQPFDLQLPEIFSSSSSHSLNTFSQFGNAINTKRLQFGIPYTPAFPPYRNNQIKSLNIHKIPMSLEAYGPPINNPIRSYFSSKENHIPLSSPSSIQRQNNIHSDLSSNLGILAPPTPPDIKYDGWKPIPGHISPPNHLSSSSHQQSTNGNAISSLSTNNNYAKLPANEIAHSSRQLSEFPTAIPSNSYGEPINNPEDHNLKQSVRQSQISDGLPPPQIPENEPFHVNQGPTTMIFTTNSPAIKTNINDNHHHNGLEGLTPPNINNDDNFPGLFRQQSHGQLRHINNNHININNNNNNDDLLVSQLPPFNNGLFSAFTNGADEFSSSYLAPPPSSFSSTGPYPSSRRPLYYAEPMRNQFKLMNNNRNLPKFIYPRNRGSIRSPIMFPIAPPMANLIPPRTTPLVNFRQPISSQLSSKLNYNNYPSSSAASAAAVASTSEFYDSAIGNSFIKNYKYSTDFDSHGSSSLNQPELIQVLSSNQPQKQKQQLEIENTDETNEIGHDETNYKFEIKVNDDIKSSSDTFNNFHNENNEAAQALAQALVSEDASSDSIQIQGSKDTYTLQIESTNDGEGMENSDGTIKHDQILSERLLHDIISAIEQPGDGGKVQILSNPPVQSLEETHKQSAVLSSPLSQHSGYHHGDDDGNNDDGQQAASELNVKSIDVTAANNQKDISLSKNKNNAALFFNNHYQESINKITSTFNDDKYSHSNNGNDTNINL